MQYFFQLGNFKGLSQAELSIVFEGFGLNKDSIKNFSEKILLVDSKELNDNLAIRIFNRLGGFIRVGKMVQNLEDFLEDEYSGKVIFGLSYIGEKRSKLTTKRIHWLNLTFNERTYAVRKIMVIFANSDG